MTEWLNKQLKLASIVLKLLSKGDMLWTPYQVRVEGVADALESPIRWLLDREYLERPDRGLYRITEKGSRVLEDLRF